MYMYIHSDYLSPSANNGNQNHYCFSYMKLMCFTIMYCISFTQEMALTQKHISLFSLTILFISYHFNYDPVSTTYSGVAIEEKHSRPHIENQRP